MLLVKIFSVMELYKERKKVEILCNSSSEEKLLSIWYIFYYILYQQIYVLYLYFCFYKQFYFRNSLLCSLLVCTE